jgi:flagellar motor switch protein FliN
VNAVHELTAAAQAGMATSGQPPQLLAAFANVKVTVQIQVGSVRMNLSDMMALKPGSSLTLDQKLGDPVLVLVNDACIAKGELYVLEDDGNRLGIKIIEILDGPPQTTMPGDTLS